MANRLTTFIDNDPSTPLSAAVLNAEFDNIVTSGTIVRTGGSWGANDDIPLLLGTSSDCRIEFNTDQTNDCLVIGVDTGSRTLLICDNGDEATNFGLGMVGNPTIVIHGPDPATHTYMEISSETIRLHSATVAHGMTDLLPTDVGAFIQLNDATGALRLVGVGETAYAVLFQGWVTTDDTTKTTGSVAAINIDAVKKSGTTVAGMGANANMVAIRNSSTTRFIFDAEGDSHQDVGTAWTNFDSEDDVQLLTDLAVAVSKADDPIKAEFQEWVKYDRERLEKLKLVTFNEDGHHFVNNSQLLRACVGAIRQNAVRIARLEQRFLP